MSDPQHGELSYLQIPAKDIDAGNKLGIWQNQGEG
jgi:hypothetical protein